MYMTYGWGCSSCGGSMAITITLQYTSHHYVPSIPALITNAWGITAAWGTSRALQPMARMEQLGRIPAAVIPQHRMQVEDSGAAGTQRTTTLPLLFQHGPAAPRLTSRSQLAQDSTVCTGYGSGFFLSLGILRSNNLWAPDVTSGWGALHLPPQGLGLRGRD